MGERLTLKARTSPNCQQKEKKGVALGPNQKKCTFEFGAEFGAKVCHCTTFGVLSCGHKKY